MQKFLNQVKKNKTGRNNTGKVVLRFRKGFNLKLKRKFVDLKRLLSGNFILIKFNTFSKSVFVALIYYLKLGVFSYILIDELSQIGDISKNFTFLRCFNKNNPGSVYEFRSLGDLKLNSVCLLQNLPVGARIFAVESRKFAGSLFSRSAGTAAVVHRKVCLRNCKIFIGIFLPSGQLTYVDGLCVGVLGKNSNKSFNKFVGVGSRQLRILRRRPRVRGVAMNPVDHPHGGGEGKTSGGRVSVSRWGWLTKGGKTVSRKKRQRTRARIKTIDKLHRYFSRVVIIPNY